MKYLILIFTLLIGAQAQAAPDITTHHYPAVVTSVYDGDTITVDIELGLSVILKAQKIRLHRINAPEMRGDEREEGTLSRDYLRDRILGEKIILETLADKRGKYGRLLGEIWLEKTNINDELVSLGLAVFKQY